MEEGINENDIPKIGDAIAIRHKMTLSLAYDHRVVDGVLGGKSLKKISDYLGNFDVKRNT